MWSSRGRLLRLARRAGTRRRFRSISRAIGPTAGSRCARMASGSRFAGRRQRGEAGQVVLTSLPAGRWSPHSESATQTAASRDRSSRMSIPATFLLVGLASGPRGAAARDERVQRLLRRAGESTVSDLSLAARARSERASPARATAPPWPSATCHIGPFSGELRFTFYRGRALVHVETVVHTQEDRRAIVYDTGLALPSTVAGQLQFAWIDIEGKLRRQAAAAERRGSRGRLSDIARSCSSAPFGSVACFPPPHQFFFPRDLTDNLSTVWYGRNHRGLDSQFGFGIRPGGARRRLVTSPGSTPRPAPSSDSACFICFRAARPRAGLEQTLRYTNGDRFQKLPGYHTLTSHWHMATTMAALAERRRGYRARRPISSEDVPATWVSRSCISPSSTATAIPHDPGPVRLTEMRGDVRRVQAAFGRPTPVLAGRRGQHRPRRGPRAARRPATGCTSFPSRSTGPWPAAPVSPFVEEHLAVRAASTTSAMGPT